MSKKSARKTRYNTKPYVKFVDGKYVNFTRIKGDSPIDDKLPKKKPDAPLSIKRNNRVVISADYMKNPEKYSQGDRNENEFRLGQLTRTDKYINVSADLNPYAIRLISSREFRRESPYVLRSRAKPAKRPQTYTKRRWYLEQDPKIRKLNQDGRIGADGKYRAGRESLYIGAAKPQVLLRFQPETHFHYDRQLKASSEEITPFRWRWEAGNYVIRVFAVQGKSDYRAELLEAKVSESRVKYKNETRIVRKLRVFGYGKSPTEAVNAMLRYPCLFHPETNSKWSINNAFKSICVVFPNSKNTLPRKAQENLNMWHVQVEWLDDKDKGYVSQPVHFQSRKVPRSMYTPQDKLKNKQHSETLLIQDKWANKPKAVYGDVPSFEEMPDGTIVHIDVQATIYNWREVDRITGKNKI